MNGQIKDNAVKIAWISVIGSIIAATIGNMDKVKQTFDYKSEEISATQIASATRFSDAELCNFFSLLRKSIRNEFKEIKSKEIEKNTEEIKYASSKKLKDYEQYIKYDVDIEEYSYEIALYNGYDKKEAEDIAFYYQQLVAECTKDECHISEIPLRASYRKVFSYSDDNFFYNIDYFAIRSAMHEDNFRGYMVTLKFEWE